MVLLSERQRKMMEANTVQKKPEHITSGLSLKPEQGEVKCTFCGFKYKPKSENVPTRCGACGREKTLVRHTL